MSRYLFIRLALLCCLSVYGCGGSDNSQPPTEIPVQLSLNFASLPNELAQGDALEVTVNGVWTSSTVGESEIYFRLQDPSGFFTIQEPITAPQGVNFTFNLNTSATIPSGEYSGDIEVVACKDANCGSTYPNANSHLNYSLRVAPVADWETFQRDTAHSGYVPIWLNPSHFSYAWEWSREPINEPIGGINAVVTSAGKVFVSTDVYFGEGVLYALNEQDGSQLWRRSFGEVPALNPPAVHDNRVFVATTGHEDTYLWAFDSATGDYLFQSSFPGQWPHYLSPTIYENQVFQGGGYFGGITYCYSTTDGLLEWQRDTGGLWDMFTPAVNADYIFHDNGGALYKIDRLTGNILTTIDDPFGETSTLGYFGAPMIGENNMVISFADGAFSGRASSNVEQYDQRLLSGFDIENNIWKWSSSNAYLTIPATANGIVYAARNTPMSLDALDVLTGDVLWSWVPDSGDTSFHRNIVLTRNLLFVSTDQAVYALDLETHAPVWSYPQAGTLSISSDRTLYIATGYRESDGRLIAIKLK